MGIEILEWEGGSMIRGTYRRRQHIPKGSSTRHFALLSAGEQRESVRKLKASGMTDEALAQLTGLARPTIAQMKEVK